MRTKVCETLAYLESNEATIAELINDRDDARETLYEELKSFLLGIHPSATLVLEQYDFFNIEYKGLSLYISVAVRGHYIISIGEVTTEYSNCRNFLAAVDNEVQQYFIFVADVQNGTLFRALNWNMYIMILPYGWSASPEKQLYFIADEHYKPYSNDPQSKEYWVNYLSGRYVKVTK